MSHQYESGITVGENAWHSLDTNIDPATLPMRNGEPYLSTERTIEISELGWTVSTRPLFLGGSEIEHDGRREFLRGAQHPKANAIVRDSDNRILGFAGPSWTPLQNAEAFGALDPFIEAGSLAWESCCSLKKGSLVTLLARIALDEEAEVVPGDRILPYVLISNYHTGSNAAEIQITATRVVCANTHRLAKSAAEAGSEPRLRLTHRKNIAATLEEGVSMIDLARSTFLATVEQYRRLAGVSISKDDLLAYVKRVFDVDAESVKMPRAWEKIEHNAENGRGSDFSRGTVWGAFNALTEWVDHDRGSDENRLYSATFDAGAKLKGRAFDLAVQLAE